MNIDVLQKPILAVKACNLIQLMSDPDLPTCNIGTPLKKRERKDHILRPYSCSLLA